MARRGGVSALRRPRHSAAAATGASAPARSHAIIRAMATQTTFADVFPLGSRLNERGHLEVGGCDTIELAREFGTPAYVVAEDDLRARARAFVAAGRGAGHEDLHVVFASKAFPCTAVLALFAQEGLWCDVASGGELHLALRAGFAPERIVLHGNAKSERRAAHGAGARRWADRARQLRRDRPARGSARGGLSARRRAAGARPRHAGRARGDAREDLHRPGRLEVRLLDRAGRRGDRAHAARRRAVAGGRARAHRLAAARARPVSRGGRRARQAGRLRGVGSRRRPRRALHRATSRRRRRIEDYVGALVRAAHAHGVRRAAAAADRARPGAVRQRGGDAVHGAERQAERLALGGGRRRHVRQPAPDALRRAATRRTIADRFDGATRVPCSPASTASPAT